MEQYLKFVASSNLKSLLGKDLVTDQITAIFELVKNSYDADSNKVLISFSDIFSDHAKIIIEDDGTGMSLDDIKNNWMIIGTDSKKNNMYSAVYKRPLNGDKGIGRFSVDRLGGLLDLKTIKQNDFQEIFMHFNWNEFEKSYQNVSDVKIPYKVEHIKGKKQGLKLSISDLRDNWDKTKINELIRNLRQFKSPFISEDNFKIIVDAPEFGYNYYEITAEKLELISSLWISVECKKENTDLVYLTVNKDGIEYEEVTKNLYNIGPLKAKVYSFNQGDKIRFKNRYQRRVREFGNIRLYRDEFRIHPYGEENNDWLDIDRRYTLGFARRFSSRDLIGYVQSYKSYNKGLMPLTSRQGLIENEEFQKLRFFVIEYTVKVLERYFFEKFKSNKNETIEKSKKNIENSTQNLNSIAKKVSEIDPNLGRDIKKYVVEIKKEQTEQLNYVKNQEELTKVYSRIAQKETFLHQLIHQALIDIKDASTAIRQLEKQSGFILDEKSEELFILLKNSIESSKTKLLTVRDDVVRTREKTKLNLSGVIKNCLSSMQIQFEENSINIKQVLDVDINYYMDKSDLEAIVTNLLTNSIKSLLEVSDRDRIIEVNLRKTNKFIVLKIQDNGIGISELNREKIFDPFFTTTEKYGGSGLGLTIVDEMLKEYNGALELVDINDPGACFLVKLRC